MEERIQNLLDEVKAYLAKNKKDLEAFRIKYVSKKGALESCLKNCGNYRQIRKKM